MADYVRLKEIPVTDDLVKFMATVPLQDLYDTLHQVSAYELKQQLDIGNIPTAIVVDGVQKGIEQARRRVQQLYADTAMLAKAIHDAFDMLKRLTRRQTGRAMESFRLAINDRIVGDESVTDSVVAGMTNEDFAVVLCPLVTYGRKLAWNPPRGGFMHLKVGTKKRKRGIYQTRQGEVVQVKLTYRERMQQVAERNL